MRTSVLSLVVVAAILSPGCGNQSPVGRNEAKTQSRAAVVVQMAQDNGGRDGPAPVANAGQPAKIERKIKYTANVQIIAEEFVTAEAGLKRALKEAQGFVAFSESGGSPGPVRTGTWRVRVPIEHFDSFLQAVAQLGEVERKTSDSEDVTEEFYDLQAHIKNRQAEEESLRQLLEKSANNMENFLAIRREMNQVRDDINRKQGRLKLLANLTDLTTITIGIREKEKYIAPSAPAKVETPTFAMRASRTFGESWHGLQASAEILALGVVGFAPWAPLAVIGLILARWFVRRARSTHATPVMPQQSV